MSIALIDYNMGNLGSVSKALEFVGARAEVISQGSELSKFDCCLLPGVGNFGDGMENLKSRGFDKAIVEFVEQGGWFFGICLGMQMLLESSEEAPGVPGLGVFPGKVTRFPSGDLKVPQIGWNSARFRPDCKLSEGLPPDCYFYFVHSFYVPVDERFTLAQSEYITPFSAVIGSDRWMASQFHPEKSQLAGLRVLKNFLTLAGELK